MTPEDVAPISHSEYLELRARADEQMRARDEDPRWTVELATGTTHDVGAHHCEVAGGALVFYDAGGAVLVAYAATRWAEVSQA